jgi:hypothetical protein
MNRLRSPERERDNNWSLTTVLAHDRFPKNPYLRALSRLGGKKSFYAVGYIKYHWFEIMRANPPDCLLRLLDAWKN